MKNVVAFVMRGPLHAGSAAGVAMLAGLVVPPLAWFSSAVVALVMLRLGPAALARMALPAIIGVVVVGALVTGQPVGVVLASIGAWAPVVAIAAVLRRRGRLDDALLAACAMGWLAVVAQYLVLADPAATWQEMLRLVLPPEQLASQTGVAAGDVERMIERMAPLMPGLLGASVVFGAVTSLLLGRWWQALLDNEGGFGREFRALRLGRVAAMIAGLVCLVAAMTTSAPFVGLAVVALALYLFQGLAVIHGVVTARGMSSGWLVALYIVMAILPPQMVTGLALVGVADAWADFRRVASG
jgi:uncharacterized protein YybS (DUF2232 family)